VTLQYSGFVICLRFVVADMLRFSLLRPEKDSYRNASSVFYFTKSVLIFCKSARLNNGTSLINGKPAVEVTMSILIYQVCLVCNLYLAWKSHMRLCTLLIF